MKNYVLHFIRHGRTEHQRQGVYMGRRTGSELSAEGIGELLALRRNMTTPRRRWYSAARCRTACRRRIFSTRRAG